MSVVLGLILFFVVFLVAYIYYESHYFKCFRCGKIFPRKKGYCLTQNRGWFCETCYKTSNVLSEGLTFTRNGALSHLKNNKGYMEPDLKRLLLLTTFLVMFTWLALHDYLIRLFFYMFGLPYP
jgi:hypothetical protein